MYMDIIEKKAEEASRLFMPSITNWISSVIPESGNSGFLRTHQS